MLNSCEIEDVVHVPVRYIRTFVWVYICINVLVSVPLCPVQIWFNNRRFCFIYFSFIGQCHGHFQIAEFRCCKKELESE